MKKNKAQNDYLNEIKNELLEMNNQFSHVKDMKSKWETLHQLLNLQEENHQLKEKVKTQEKILEELKECQLNQALLRNVINQLVDVLVKDNPELKDTIMKLIQSVNAAALKKSEANILSTSLLLVPILWSLLVFH